MTLPIDPEAVRSTDIGEKRATLEMDHDHAVEHVRETFAEVGFGFPAEFSPSDLLNEKVDADRDPYYVLGACNPRMADRALDASDNKIGALFPCNVVIWQEAPNTQVVYHVSIMRIARLTGMAPASDEMADIIAETGQMVEEAYDRLAQA